MKKTTRILSLILALCLCFGLMATAAFAVDGEDTAAEAKDETVADIKLEVSTVGASSEMTVKIEATAVVTEKQAEAAAVLGAEALLAKQFVCTLKDSAGFIAANEEAVKAADVKINDDSLFEIKEVKVADGAVVVTCALKADALDKAAKAEDIKAKLSGASTTLCAELAKVEVKETVKSTVTAEVKGETVVVAKGETEAVINGNMKFVDVPSNKWFSDAVVWAVDHDPAITEGKDETHFVPNGECTRGEVVTFLWRANGCPKAEKAENPFKDVEKGRFYYDAVLWAVEKGIAKGITEDTFEPNTVCTRAHVVTFLCRAEDGKPTKTENPFKDVEAGRFYTDAVLWAVENEITEGVGDDLFAPDSTCTRAMVVTFLYRDMAE